MYMHEAFDTHIDTHMYMHEALYVQVHVDGTVAHEFDSHMV